MKTSELTGAALDWAVAKCEGHDAHVYGGVVRTTMRGRFGSECSYSTDWAQGGPIIERERLLIQPEIGKDGAGNAWYCVAITPHDAYGDTPLIAAMRCYVASQLGDEVELPEELNL
jgi:hypothetical protein